MSTIVEQQLRTLIEAGDVDSVVAYLNRAEVPKIHSCMVVAREALPAIGKNQKNAAQGWKFRSIDDVQNVLGKALTEAKVALYPEYKLIRFEPIGKGYMAVVRGTYRLVAVEDGSSYVATFLGQAADFGDKAVSKAKAMAFKYFAFQTFQIPVLESVLDDPDKNEVPIDTTSLRDKYWGKKKKG